MPSALHEGLLELFRNRTTLAAELLDRVFGVELPGFEVAELGDSVLSVALELRSDGVVELSSGGKTKFAIILEVQLGEADKKRSRWPLYSASLFDRLRCPVAVLVVAPNAGIAQWASEAVELGPGHRFVPLVLGPEVVPRVSAEEALAAPQLGVLSVVAHGGEEGGLELALRVLPSLSQIEDDELRQMYYDLIAAALPSAAQRELEEMAMPGNYEFQSEVAKNLIARGQAQGEVRGAHLAQVDLLLKSLQRRGFSVDSALKARIETASPEAIEQWMMRLVDGEALDAIFRD